MSLPGLYETLSQNLYNKYSKSYNQERRCWNRDKGLKVMHRDQTVKLGMVAYTSPPALRRLRQKAHWKFKADLGLRYSPGSTQKRKQVE